MITMTAARGNMIGLVDVTAGTPWFALVPGLANYTARLMALEVDNGATENGLFLMRPLASKTILTAQVATDTTLILDGNPSPSGDTIASGDQVVYLASDGTYRRVTVSSWNGSSLTLTVSALPAAVAADSPMWNFGVHTDTEPNTSLPFPKLHTPASDVTPYPLECGFAGWAAGQPLAIYCPNATNKTKLNNAQYAHTAA